MARWVELSDGQYENMADPIDEVVNHRRLPGEGEFPIRAVVEVCQEFGYHGPVGRRGALGGAAQPADRQIFERAYETTAAQFGAGVA